MKVEQASLYGLCTVDDEDDNTKTAEMGFL